MAHTLKEVARTAWILLAVLLTYSIRANASAGNISAFAQSCSVTAVTASARIFSDNDKNRWKEYANAQLVPENGEWSETAYVWSGPDSPVVIDVEGVGEDEDFADSTYYCFDVSGKLSSLEHEFRTAWEWGFAEQKQFDKNGKETANSKFFSMKDRGAIPRPQAANEVREAMTVKVYRRLSEVPFSPLLTHGTKTE